MGCCISSNKKIPHQPKPPVMPEPHCDNITPPPCLEEETVKEVVLSETSLPKPQQNSKHNPTQMPIIQERSIESEDLNLIINRHGQEEEISQVSQSHVSDIFSISERRSTTTVALTDINDDEAINRELNYSSPAKVPRQPPNAGEISPGAKSPAKRAESSRVMSRPVTGRTVPRNVGPTGVRSGSCSSSRVGRRSPGKFSSGRSGGGKLRVKNEAKMEVNDGVLVENSELTESLDNPRVSLECFIFL